MVPPPHWADGLSNLALPLEGKDIENGLQPTAFEEF